MVDPNEIEAQCTEIIRLLKLEREHQGLAMLTVAQRAGLSQQMVSYVERGIRRPTLDTVLRIAAALEIDFAEVIGKSVRTITKRSGK